MRTHMERASEWGRAYSERARSAEMGRAVALADDVYEAVARGAEAQAEVLYSQREILAGAIAEIRRVAQDEVRSEVLAQARSLVAGAVRIAHTELDRVAADVLSGKHFSK